METKKEKITEGPYATIYQLCLGESTRIETKAAEGFNAYQVWERTYLVTRVHGGWLYSREFAGTSMDSFVPDTRPAEHQTRANRPRQ